MKQKNVIEIFKFFLKHITLSATDDDVLPHVPFFPEIKYLGIISTAFFQTSLRLGQKNIKFLLVPTQKSQNNSMAQTQNDLFMPQDISLQNAVSHQSGLTFLQGFPLCRYDALYSDKN